MRVLVTGGLGLVGRAVVRRLLAKGHEVRIADRAPQGVADVPGGVELVGGDLESFDAVLGWVSGMDAVVHLAALTHPAAGPAQDVYRVGAAGTFNVYEAAARAGIKRVSCASSINALGYNFGVAPPFPIGYLPIDELHFTEATDAYSLAKQAVEAIGTTYWKRDGISGLQLRLPYIYDLDEDPKGPRGGYVMNSRRVVAELAASSPAEQQATVQKVIARDAAIRAGRLKEVPAEVRAERLGGASPLDGFRSFTDFFTGLSAQDTAIAFEASLTAELTGSYAPFVCETDNIVSAPSAWLAELFFPEAKGGDKLAGEQSLVSGGLARDLVGFTPQHSVAEWIAAYD